MTNGQATMDDGWEKYEQKTIARIPTWAPDKPGNPGEIQTEDGREYLLGFILEGGLVKDEIATVKGEPRRVLTIHTTKNGDISFWPNAMAIQILDEMHPGPGDMLRIVFTGWKKSSTPGRKYKGFELYRKRVTQPAPQPRPEPIPVTEADRERDFQARQAQAQAGPQSQDPGVAWINEQKRGLDQVPTSAEKAIQ